MTSLNFPDSSYSASGIQDYIKALLTNPPIHIYINIINNRLVLNVKDGYRLKLQTPETIKLFGSTKKLIDKSQNGENVPRLEVV